MARWQDVAGIRRRSGSGRCGWCSNTRPSTSLSGRRSLRSPAKLGMTNETLRKWVRQAEIDGGARPGVSSAEAERVKELERENRELRRANEILKAASVFFARELDPQPPKR